jgi:hypothetical protein
MKLWGGGGGLVEIRFLGAEVESGSQSDLVDFVSCWELHKTFRKQCTIMRLYEEY